jgi:hypothetical protein
MNDVEVLVEWSHHWNSVLALIKESRLAVNIASFGIHLPPKRVAFAIHEALERGVKVNLLVGRHDPMKLDAINSIICLQTKLRGISEMLPKMKIRVMTSHTKVVMNELCAIVGGRNLSFSNWPDLSFRFWKKTNPIAFHDLHEAYRSQFEDAETLEKFLKVTREELEKQMTVLVEEAIDRRQSYAVKELEAILSLDSNWDIT